MNKQLGDGVAVRLNGVWHDAGVAGRDVVKNERWGIVPSVAFGLNSATQVVLSYYHLETDDIPDTGIPYDNPTFRPRTDGRARVLQVGDGSPVKVDRSTWYGLKNRDFREDTADIGTIKLDRDFGGGLALRNTLRYAQTGQDYVWTQPDDSQGNIYYGLVYRRQNNRVTELQTIANQTDLYGSFTTGSLTHNFSTGVEFSREQGENDSYALTLPTGAASCTAAAIAAFYCTDLNNPNPNDAWAGVMTRNNNPSNSRNVTKSAYLSDTTDLSSEFQLNLGLRFDRYESKFTSAASTAAATPGVRSIFKREDDLFNYQVGLNYKPTRDGSFYASYATSSTPTGNALAQGSDPSALSSAVNANLKPEKNKTVEVGTKWSLFDEALLATAAIFYTETQNSRITLQDIPSPWRVRSGCGVSSWAWPARSPTSGKSSAAIPIWTASWSRVAAMPRRQVDLVLQRYPAIDLATP
ncbi:TonB-dependent receptor [Niveispirillum sp. KHB5.9]|uniref:TonB-dependent receptor n=1 Tax=Niveispirillum sp. KHB5.9 TaxID=3400269 RepID=UPI003A8BC29C